MNKLKRIGEHRLKFISRLPGNFNLEKELKARAWENEALFQALGLFSDKKDAASYRVQEFKEELHGKLELHGFWTDHAKWSFFFFVHGGMLCRRS